MTLTESVNRFELEVGEKTEMVVKELMSAGFFGTAGGVLSSFGNILAILDLDKRCGRLGEFDIQTAKDEPAA